MKRVLVGVMASATLGAWGQTEIKGMSFFAVYERCQNGQISSAATPEGVACVAYLSALIDRYRIFEKPPYCLPPQAKISDVVSSVLSLGGALLKESESSSLRIGAAAAGMAPVIVDAALMRSYPCDTKK